MIMLGMNTIGKQLHLAVDNVSFEVKDKEILNDISLSARNGHILAVMGPTGLNTIGKQLHLVVDNVSFEVKDRDILNDISLSARNGHILAVMGPTGSGKTSLLNIIAGRQRGNRGRITLNGNRFDKRLRRKLAFVQQNDVFFSQLTLLETLEFTANIRIPEDVPISKKKETINKIVQSLCLTKCLNTVIGDVFVKGLSGGEKKRASIACELLTNPDLLLLDEPTSGLDSKTALDIMNCIRDCAKVNNKLVITTIHQPASKLYHMFDELVLLLDGYSAYTGTTKNVMPHFRELGFVCSEADYNPADFLLEVLSTENEADIQRIRSHGYNSRFKDTDNGVTNIRNTCRSNGQAAGDALMLPDSDTDSLLEETKLTLLGDGNGGNVVGGDGNIASLPYEDKWSTSWWTQYKTLSWRGLKQSLGVLKQGYSLVQSVIISVICSLSYFQIGVNLKTARDIFGIIFFYGGYWTFIPAFSVMASFPAERPIVAKERSSGAYRLSAYYCAKMTSEIPFIFTEPSIMYILFFWLGGFGGPAEFFYSLLIMLLQTFAAFGFGLVLSVIFKDLRMVFTTMFSYLVSGYLLGGFFSQNVPYWMEWIKYTSIFYYPYAFTISLIASNIEDTPCNQTKIGDFLKCTTNSSLYVTSEDILQQANVYLSVDILLLIMIGYAVVIRIACYMAFRLKHETLV